jgi:hypothetical protein
VAALSSSTYAAKFFADIRDAWNNPTEAGHQLLRRELVGFLAAYPHDGLAPLANMYLVLNLMENPSDWQRAEVYLSERGQPPPGTVRDLYLIAKARLLRHKNQPDQAYDLLRPLVGKMVDPIARGMLEEEVTRAAIEAHHDYEAVAYMDAWLRGASEEERDVVRGKVAKIIFDLPEPVLENTLGTMRASGGSRGYGAEIQRLIATRLGEIAVARGDPGLARWLVDPDGGAPMIAGDAGVALGELATSKRGLGSVSGRTIGLLVPTGSPDLRGEAADVARGAAWALDIPRTDPGSGDGVRLVTRDDEGDPTRMVAGFEELAGEGASIIVTALDQASADTAVAWGDKNGLAVITLSSPNARKPGPFTFSVGEPPAAELDALVSAIAAKRGADAKVAPVADGDPAKLLTQGWDPRGALTLLPPVACDVEPARAGEPRFPVALWERAGVHAWLIAGPPECVRDVFHDVGAGAKGGIFALGLAGATMQERAPAGARVIAVGAGAMPNGTASPADSRDADIRALTARLGGRPSWWLALGRDAVALARKAMAQLPADSVTDPSEIARRRRAARDAVAGAHERLWTSDAGAFDSAHVLGRALRVTELQAQ